jgi:hypothetical protein
VIEPSSDPGVILIANALMPEELSEAVTHHLPPEKPVGPASVIARRYGPSGSSPGSAADQNRRSHGRGILDERRGELTHRPRDKSQGEESCVG